MLRDRYPRSRDDFEIAVICALSFQRDAVEALLDEEYETDGVTYGKTTGDHNAYTTGRLGNQDVVVAYMPDMGMVGAAAVAANLISSFTRIKVALVAGVCRGVPMSNDGEVLLGDVIIGTQVVLADFGRLYPDGLCRKTENVEDILGRPNPEIRAFVGRLCGYRARRRLLDKTHSFSTQISAMERFSSSAYPGPEHDILYAADYRHEHRKSRCNICAACDSDGHGVCDSALNSSCVSLGCQGELSAGRKRLQRAIGSTSDGRQFTAAETEKARRPSIHFGRIACGEKFLKSGVQRNRLAAKDKVIGFETESAGIWDYIPTIVVKGVCDYADSHKSERWQKYAAATAAACTKAILEEWRNTDRVNQSLPAQQANLPAHWTVTRPANQLFTGRHEIICDLKSIIQKAVDDRLRQKPCHIVISGMGGQGKSEICLQLVHHFRTTFWGIFWIDMSTTMSARKGFCDIASRLGVEGSTWESGKHCLANLHKPWLLVLDNADDYGVDYQDYFPASALGIVILTSRNAECQQHATQKWLELEGLTDGDAETLLFRAARVPDDQRRSLRADALPVVKLLQSHPLALIQAGSYISRGHCSLREYPQVYQRQRKRLLAFVPSQARSRYQDIYTTFEASAEALRLSEVPAARDALQLLHLLAAYGPSRLPLRLFEAAWNGARLVPSGEVPDSNLSTLTQWHLAQLPAFLQIEAETCDLFRLIEALDVLKAFSLIRMHGEGSSSAISMHTLVHAWSWERLSREQQHTCWAQAGCVVALSGLKVEMWYPCAQILQSHLQAVTSLSTSTMFSSDSTVEICRILVNCGRLLYHLPDNPSLIALLNRLYAYFGLDRLVLEPQWLELYCLTAQALLDSGLIRDALTIVEQMVGLQEQMLTEGHPSHLAAQHVLARAWLANGQVKQAVTLLEQVVKVREQTLAENHPERVASQQVLARAWLANGQVKEAATLLDEVVRIREHTLTEDHPERIASQELLVLSLVTSKG